MRPPGHLLRLRAALQEQAASDGVTVALSDACGAVEVRVSGEAAGLRLRFDCDELQPGFVRSTVRRITERYRTSLHGRQGKSAQGGPR